MRKLMYGAAVALALSVGPASALAEGAKEIIARAVKAHGGADALQRARALSRNGKGVLEVAGKAPFTSEEILNLPGQLRTVTEVGRNRLIRVLNGGKGWQQGSGAAAEVPKERLAELQEDAYVLWIATLAPLLKDGFTFTSLAESKVNDRPAAGVNVASPGKPDLALYFDKESGLLVKIARKAGEGGVKVDKEHHYSEHKEVEGVRLPGREAVFVNGAKVYEITYSDYKLLTKVDEKAFERP